MKKWLAWFMFVVSIILSILAIILFFQLIPNLSDFDLFGDIWKIGLIVLFVISAIFGFKNSINSLVKSK